MPSAPEVSVIVPYLDAAPFLAEAIDSVRAQTVGDWELILVDDGSSDESPAIAARAAAAEPRVRLLGPDPARRGAAAARNRGIEVARGRFVAFLDADDRLEAPMLESTLACLRTFPTAAAVVGPTLWWYPGGERPDWTEVPYGLTPRLHAPPKFLVLVQLLQTGPVPCVGAMLIRKAVLDDLGGFEERFRLYEDQTLWAKLFLRYPVASTPTVLLRYRQHPRSTSALAAAAGEYAEKTPHRARAAFVDWVAADVARAGVDSAAVRLGLAVARAPYGGLPARLAGRVALRFTHGYGRWRKRWYRLLQRFR